MKSGGTSRIMPHCRRGVLRRSGAELLFVEAMVHLDPFLEYLRTLPDSLIYILLGISAFVENVFPPAPGDTITAFGAFLAGKGRLSFMWVFFSTTAGSFAGFMCLYALGRILGKKFFVEQDIWLFKAESISKAEAWFRHYGYSIVLINRFLPGLRSVISIASGIARLDILRVSLLSLLSAAAWNMIWLWMGYTLSTNWRFARNAIEVMMTRYHLTLVIVGCVAAVLYATRYFYLKYRNRRL